MLKLLIIAFENKTESGLRQPRDGRFRSDTAESYSHGDDISHRAPFLRQRSCDHVAVEIPATSDRSRSRGGKQKEKGRQTSDTIFTALYCPRLKTAIAHEKLDNKINLLRRESRGAETADHSIREQNRI